MNDGGPAFPGHGEIFIEGPQGLAPQSAWGMEGSTGMTIRDYFAAKAMQAWFSVASIAWDQKSFSLASERSYQIADAMIEARKKSYEHTNA